MKTKDLINTKIILSKTPRGKLEESDFEIINEKVPKLKKNQMLIKNVYISIDAANRAWLQSRTYREQIFPGEVMGGYSLGKVVVSKNKKFNIGDYVEGDFGWQKYSIMESKHTAKVTVIKGKESIKMSVLGITGKTAYFGLQLANIKKGSTVCISAAAGAVGNVVGQIAKLYGCKVVGLTGSDKKSSWLISTLGFDHAINYKKGNIAKEIKMHS